MTGGTGYIGSRVIPALVARGHEVRALVRAASASRLPAGCTPVVGDALDATTFVEHVAGATRSCSSSGRRTRARSKAAEFERVDFVSVRESVRAADDAAISHFVYLSVAPAASVMRAYVDVRMRGEALVREFVAKASGRSATFRSARGTCSARAIGGPTRSFRSTG